MSGEGEDANIGRCLYTALRAYNERALQGIRALGHDRVTLSHAAVLPHIDPDGTRLTLLAQRAGMTKQSASQLVRDLELAGYVQRRPDEKDRRAERIEFTPLGQKFRRDAYDVKQDQEDELTRCLGLAGKRQLRKLLLAFPWQGGSDGS